jgi:hypothetical protein
MCVPGKEVRALAHLHSALAALDWPPDTRVLCFDGDQGLLDWLGPRVARVAHRSQIHGGEKFDVVVSLQGLGVVGRDSRGIEPYLAHVASMLEHAQTDATLVLAVDNALGVRYVTGHTAPSGRPFDTLESYPFGTVDRAMTLTQLTEVLDRSDLRHRVLGAFPDVLTSRCLLSRDLWDIAPELPRWLPIFQPVHHHGIDAIDEESLWSVLCSTGVGFEFSNGWVAIAQRGKPATMLPSDVAASIVNDHRVPEFETRTRFVVEGKELLVSRAAHSGEVTVAAPPVYWHGGTEPFAHGIRLDTLIVDASTREQALRDWIAILPDTQPFPVDLAPWNIIVTESGLTPVDQEWTVDGYPRSAAIARALALCVYRDAERRRSFGTDAEATVMEVAMAWARAADIELTTHDFEQFVHHQGQLESAITGLDAAKISRDWRLLLETQLRHARKTRRVDIELSALHADVRELNRLLDQRTPERAMRYVRRAVGRIRPRGRTAAGPESG